jgi:hypothetical protein
MVKAGHPVNAPKSGVGMRTEGQARSSAGGNIDPGIQTEIGKHLRAIYDDVISEPVPSKFMELLEKLERSSGKKS